MRSMTQFVVRRARAFLLLAAVSVLPTQSALAAQLEIFHADSLAGPMGVLKRAFEAERPGVSVWLTSGVSRQLAQRILSGDNCDVFAPSSPAVIDEDLMNMEVRGTGKTAALWYVVFSANEMVIVTARGNPLGIRRAADLLRPDVKVARITGEKDLATGRTIEFLKRAGAQEQVPDLAQKVVERTPGDPGKPMTVPELVNAVRQGNANAGVVYYSAAVAAREDVDIVRFPDSVNLSQAIRNAATVPGNARNVPDAIAFVRFLLSPEGQAILKETGQPPVVPALRQGAVPVEIR